MHLLAAKIKRFDNWYDRFSTNDWLFFGLLAITFIALIYITIKVIVSQSRLKREELEATVATRTKELAYQKSELAHQHEIISSSLRKLELLSEVGQQLNNDLNFDSLSEKLYQNLKELMPMQAFGIFLYNDDSDRLECHFLMKDGQRLPAFEIGMQNASGLIAHRCIRSREPIIINTSETPEDLAGLQVMHQIGNQYISKVYYPLVAGQRISGLLVLQSYEFYAYQEDQVDILKILAPYTLVALENARSYKNQVDINEQLTLSQQEIADTLELVSKANRSLHLDDLLDTFRQTISRLFAFDGGIIHLINEQEKEMYMYTAYGSISPEALSLYRNTPLPITSSKSAITYVVQKKKVIYTPQVSVNTRMQPFDKKVHKVYPFVSGLFLPLEWGTQVLGCISFLSLDKPFMLTEKEINKIKVYVGQIGNSLNNALMFQKAQQASQVIQEKNEILAAVNEELNQKNRSITDSIDYARYLQESILPDLQTLRNYVTDGFVLYKPRDVLSGDFYWIARKVSLYYDGRGRLHRTWRAGSFYDHYGKCVFVEYLKRRANCRASSYFGRTGPTDQ